MSKVIDAVYENGVFQPLEEVDIKEHTRVEIKIISRDELRTRFRGIIERIQNKTSTFSPDDIEADIAQAVKEVRAAKRAR
jgi:predicted DNA-binding antitoxin AbrB/MazE fold protein